MEVFQSNTWLRKWPDTLAINSILRNSLDAGEASVIQLALDLKVKTVCIDELAGRRVARLCGISLTGSIGVLLRAKREGKLAAVKPVLTRMKEHGIWIGEEVVAFALKQSEEAYERKAPDNQL